MSRLRERISEREGWFWPVVETSYWDYVHTHDNLVDFLLPYAQGNGVVVQANGHCGFYTKRYAELFQQVYTFEPDPVNFLCLTLNCDFEHVVKLQACAGAEPGLLGLVDSRIGSDGMLPTMKVDDLSLTDCDLLQFSSAGFEYFGLLGAEKTIAKYRPTIALAWHDAHRYNVSLKDIEDYLDRWNYKLVTEHREIRVYTTN